MDASTLKVAAAAAGLVAAGAIAGYFIGNAAEKRKHALDFVDEDAPATSASNGSEAVFVDAHSEKPHHHHHHHHQASGSETPAPDCAGCTSELVKIAGNTATTAGHDDHTAAGSGGEDAAGPAPGLDIAAAGGATGGSGATPSPSVHPRAASMRTASFDSSLLGGSAVGGATSGGRRVGGPVIVGVAGASGSGKTSIAELIAGRLTGCQRVLSISSDNYYKTLGPGVASAEYNFDHPSAIDFDLLADNLECLRRGDDCEVPNYDFVTHKRTDKTTHVCGKSTSVIIIDGIFALWAPRVRSQCDVTIFCSEDLDICLARRLRRDLVERGRTVESVLRQYIKFVKPGFEQFVEPSMAHADLIVPRARENAVAIKMLAREIQRRVDDNARWATTSAKPGPAAAAAPPVVAAASTSSDDKAATGAGAAATDAAGAKA